MNHDDNQTLALAALKVEDPDVADVLAMVRRVREHIGIRLAGNATPIDDEELLRLCQRLVDLGASEAVPWSVGGYASRYVRALELHPLVEAMAATLFPPASAFLASSTRPPMPSRESIKKFTFTISDLVSFYTYTDPNHIANGATAAALPVLSGKFLSLPLNNPAIPAVPLPGVSLAGPITGQAFATAFNAPGLPATTANPTFASQILATGLVAPALSNSSPLAQSFVPTSNAAAAPPAPASVASSSDQNDASTQSTVSLGSNIDAVLAAAGHSESASDEE